MTNSDPILDADLNQVLSLMQRGQTAQARTRAIQLCQRAHDRIEPWSLLGAIHGHLGEFSQAEHCYRRVVQLQPAASEAHRCLGLALTFQGQTASALSSFREAVRLDPQSAAAHEQLGCLLRDIGHYEDAIQELRKAKDLDASSPRAAVHLGGIYKHLERYEDAEACFAEALRLDPKHQDAVAGRAAILELRGDFQGAYDLLHSLIDNHAATINTGVVMAKLAKRFDCAAEAQQLLTSLLQYPGLAPVERELGEFALAELCDRAGDYPRAFDHYRKGNMARPQPFDANEYSDRVTRRISTWNSERLARIPPPQHSTMDPVFIVGMPRSGTTLVEQILASHPQVHGGGELPYVTDMLALAPAFADAGEIPAPTEIDRLRRFYLERLTALNNGSPLVTDKLPGNFEWLGLLWKLFPGAKIIHCLRNPLDTCLSCYLQNFGERHAYARDLESLGRVYRDYHRLMEHWRDIVKVPMLEIRYENLVANQETWSRKLVTYCGLDWDARCLAFHESSRLAGTASYDQVRRPMYTGSVNRWRHYAGQIEPLRAALGGLAEDNIASPLDNQ